MNTRGAWTKSTKIVCGAAAVSALVLFLTPGEVGKPTGRIGTGYNTVSETVVSPSFPTRNAYERFQAVPLAFEENLGQTAREVRYLSHGSGYELFLTNQEAVMVLHQPAAQNLSALDRHAYFRSMRQNRRAGKTMVLRMGFEGANFQARVSGTEPLPGKANYFVGNEPEKWHTGIPTFAQVKYAQIYPGVDLVFYGNQRKLEYDFVVAPGADPNQIALCFKGARKLRINSSGDLILRMARGQVALQRPVFYQLVNGERRGVEGKYSIGRSQRVTFSAARYDHSQPLIIDPVLNYSTYLGGSAAGDTGLSIAVDSLGDAFVTGQTFSTTFPTQNGFGAGNANGVAFVTEMNPSGTALLYSTYLGGTGGDFGLGIALDPSNNVYVAGITFSADFPTTANALKPGPNAGASAGTSFFSKISPAGIGAASLVYSSYVGGVSAGLLPDFANAVAADASGNAYITGFTESSPGSGLANFPVTASAFQSTLGSASGNAFLTKIATTQSGASSLAYSSYLGGNGANAVSSTQDFGDEGLGVALDGSNNAYIMGTTTSTNFPTTSNAFQANSAPPAAVGGGTAFVSRFNTTLSGANSLVYSTYLGGDVADFGTGIAVKPGSMVAYVTGTTSSPAFPTFPANTFQTAAGTAFPAAFVTLLDTSQPAGTALVYSTLLGGSFTTAFGIKADASGDAYVAGGTAQSAFPVTEGAFQQAFVAGAPAEGFVSKLHPGGNGATDLLYSTLLGGSGSPPKPDVINGIALDGSNNAYITGITFSTSATFPVFPSPTAATPAFQTSLPAGAVSAAFVAKLTLIPTLTVLPSSVDFGAQAVGVTSKPQTVTLTNNTSDPIPFAVGALSFSGSNAADFASPSNTCGASIGAGASCTISLTFTPSAASPEAATLVITLTITDGGLSSSQSFNVSLTGTGAAAAPGVGLSPSSLKFGGQLETTTSDAQTVTLTNTGTSALTINSIAASGDFAETNNCPINPASLAANGTCTISVTFSPKAVGPRAGTLTITDNASGSPHAVPLTGTGWDFTLTASSASIRAKKTINVDVTMTPLGGFNQAVALSCTIVLRNKSTCEVDPHSVTASDGVTPQTAVVTVRTNGLIVPQPRTRILPAAPRREVMPFMLALILLALMFRISRARMQLGLITAALCLLALAGCGYVNTQNHANALQEANFRDGKNTLTITGTSGGVSKTITVKLTEN